MYENAFTSALLDWLESYDAKPVANDDVVTDEVVSDDDPLAPWNLL